MIQFSIFFFIIWWLVYCDLGNCPYANEMLFFFKPPAVSDGEVFERSFLKLKYILLEAAWDHVSKCVSCHRRFHSEIG